MSTFLELHWFNCYLLLSCSDSSRPLFWKPFTVVSHLVLSPFLETVYSLMLTILKMGDVIAWQDSAGEPQTPGNEGLTLDTPNTYTRGYVALPFHQHSPLMCIRRSLHYKMKSLGKTRVSRSSECFRGTVRNNLVRWLVFELHHAFFIFSRGKWNFMTMCFVLEQNTGLLASAIHPWLSS